MAKRPTILLVEDDIADKELFQETVKGKALTAHASGMASALLFQKTANIDVAVVDVDLASDNGYAVAQALQKNQTDLPIIVTSNLFEEDMPVVAKNMVYISKRVLPKKILLMLEEGSYDRWINR